LLNTVLVIDDERWILKGIIKTFDWARYGFAVLYSTTNAADALQFLSKRPVDVVFSDIKMPEMTGLELIGKIRETCRPDTLFVMITGYDDYLYMREAIRNHVFDYCLKPIIRENADEVLKRLREHIDLYSGRLSSGLEIQTDNHQFSMLIEYIRVHYAEELLLKDLAERFFFHHNYLCHLFKKHFSMTYSQYLTGIRMNKAQELLRHDHLSKYEVAALVGYRQYAYFRQKYMAYWGYVPGNRCKDNQ